MLFVIVKDTLFPFFIPRTGFAFWAVEIHVPWETLPKVYNLFSHNPEIGNLELRLLAIRNKERSNMSSTQISNDETLEKLGIKRVDSFEIEKPLFSDNESVDESKESVTVQSTRPSVAEYDSRYLTLKQVQNSFGSYA